VASAPNCRAATAVSSCMSTACIASSTSNESSILMVRRRRDQPTGLVSGFWFLVPGWHLLIATAVAGIAFGVLNQGPETSNRGPKRSHSVDVARDADLAQHQLHCPEWRKSAAGLVLHPLAWRHDPAPQHDARGHDVCRALPGRVRHALVAVRIEALR